MPCRSSTARWTAGQLARWRRFANAILAPFANEDSVTFTAYRQNDAVGHITLSKNWNGYTLIDEIAVSADARRQGIAGALLDYAKQWRGSRKPQV